MVRQSNKPVRKCHSCKLNRGDHCWLYAFPKLKWSGGRKCPAFGHQLIIKEFEDWLKYQPEIKTKKDLRRGLFRTFPRHTKETELSEKERKRILSCLHAGLDVSE